MTQHFTKNTVSAAFYCKKCGRETQHRVDGGRKGPCLECLAKLQAMPKSQPKPAATQTTLF